MQSSLYIELEPEAIALVRSLMPFFGTSDIASTVAKALGVAKVATPFITSEGVLTVVDPRSEHIDDIDQSSLVDIAVRDESPAAAAA